MFFVCLFVFGGSSLCGIYQQEKSLQGFKVVLLVQFEKTKTEIGFQRMVTIQQVLSCLSWTTKTKNHSWNEQLNAAYIEEQRK